MTLTHPATPALGVRRVCGWVPPHERSLLFDAKSDVARTVARPSGVRPSGTRAW